MSSVAEIETAIGQLNKTERNELFDRLEVFRLDEQSVLSEDWKEELDRRGAKIDTGEATLTSSKEVWKRVNGRFGTNL